MRICCWTERYWPVIGGIEALVGKLLPSLRDLGHNIIVITGKEVLDWPDYEEHDGIAIHRFPFHQLASSRDISALARTRQRLSRLCKEFAPELTHVHDVFPGALFCVGASGMAKPPLLLTLHCDMSDLACSKQTLFGRVIRSAQWVTGCSEVVLKKAQDAVPEIADHSSVVYSGVEDSPVKPSPLPFDPPHILCMGRLRPGKGFDTAISALPLVQKRFPEVRLSVSGGGPERAALERRAADVGVSSSVNFLGWADPTSTNRRAIWDLINTATMVVMPSRQDGFWFEGFGMVAVEGSIMERPVVASRSGGLCNAVADGQTGLLVEPDDIPGFANAICELLENPSRAKEMGQAGRRRSLERFGWNNHVVSGYNALYHKLVQET